MAQTCKQVRAEILTILYRTKVLYFSCTCALGLCLRNNQFFLSNAQHIKLHLRGPEARTAIPLLSQCANRKTLHITVSGWTAFYGSFHRHPNATGRSFTYEFYKTLNESSGVGELRAIGGVESVQVTHSEVTSERILKRDNVEVLEFEAYLKERLEGRGFLKVNLAELNA